MYGLEDEEVRRSLVNVPRQGEEQGSIRYVKLRVKQPSLVGWSDIKKPLVVVRMQSRWKRSGSLESVVEGRCIRRFGEELGMPAQQLMEAMVD